MILDDNTSLLIEYLSKLDDPRKDKGKRYKLKDLILLTLYASLSGQFTSIDIVDFVEDTFDYFHELIGLKSVPSHDTFSRIMRLIDYNQLANVLGEWLSECYPELKLKINDKEILHIDGKAIKAAAKKSAGEKPVYLFNAMYEGGSISLETVQIGDKENEISSIKEILDLFNIEDTIVTVDAIGCNNTVINEIVSRKGSYLIPVKDNAKKLKNAIKEEIVRLKSTLLKKDKTKSLYDILDKTVYQTSSHGREETYKAALLTDTAFIYEKFGTSGYYGTIGRIMVIEKETKYKDQGKEKVDKTITYSITDLESINVKDLLRVKLSHWNIEAQHWLLDVQLNEDRYTARKENAIVNGSILKRFCMRIKKEYCKDAKTSLHRFTTKNTRKIERITELLFKDIAK